MICKYCNAEVEQDLEICPVCGKSLTEEPTPVTEEPVEETVVEETVAEELVEQEDSVVPEAEEELTEEAVDEAAKEETEDTTAGETGWEMPPVQKKKTSPWLIVLAVSSAVIALGVLAIALLTFLGVDLKPRPNDIQAKDSYVVTIEDAEKKAETVVATIGDKTLNNAQLQIYYRMQLQDFLSYYSSYLTTLGLDLSKPLAEQTCYFDDTLSWEQYLLDIAIQTWQNNQTMALLAEESGFTLDETTAAELAKLPEMLEEQAVEGEYENAEAMIKEVLGSACTMETYIDYVTMITLRNAYYASEYEKLTPNEEEIHKYYVDNEEEFTESGITKESGLISSVRHILVIPKGGTENEDGSTTYSDEEWKACLTEAEKILKEWKDGEATEESFAKLADTYTEDGGSKGTGGLYTEVAPGSNFVEEFLNWSIDMSRKTGDTGIVKTQFGYHIMYFVEGEPYWMNMARTNLLSERTTEMINAAEEKWPIKVNYKKIALAELELQ